MGLDYIDLYLAHWPIALQPKKIFATRTKPDPTASDEEKDILDLEHCPESIAASVGGKGSYVPTWNAMKALVRTGKCRAVGLSNFAIAQINELLPHASHDDVPISCNQIEAHPWLPNDKVIRFMKDQHILPTVYCPFAPGAVGPKLLENQTVVKVAKKNGMAEGQVLLSWAVMRGTVPLPKSQTPERIKANLVVRKLPDEDFEALNRLQYESDASGRTVDFGKLWGVKMFGD